MKDMNIGNYKDLKELCHDRVARRAAKTKTNLRIYN